MKGPGTPGAEAAALQRYLTLHRIPTHSFQFSSKLRK